MNKNVLADVAGMIS